MDVVIDASGDRLHILGSPQHEVDRVEGRIPQAGRWVDRNPASVLATVEALPDRSGRTPTRASRPQSGAQQIPYVWPACHCSAVGHS